MDSPPPESERTPLHATEAEVASDDPTSSRREVPSTSAGTPARAPTGEGEGTAGNEQVSPSPRREKSLIDGRLLVPEESLPENGPVPAVQPASLMVRRRYRTWLDDFQQTVPIVAIVMLTMFLWYCSKKPQTAALALHEVVRTARFGRESRHSCTNSHPLYNHPRHNSIQTVFVIKALAHVIF